MRLLPSDNDNDLCEHDTFYFLCDCKPPFHRRYPIFTAILITYTACLVLMASVIGIMVAITL